MDKKNHLPILLAILDGWGMSQAWGGNAISMASPKTMNSLWAHFPHAVMQAFKPLAGNQKFVANSEVGHSTIGAGRIVRQNIDRISDSISDSSFFQNQKIIDACSNVLSYNGSLHLISLYSDGGVYGHTSHLQALLRLAKKYNLQKVYIHIIADGIDCPSRSGLNYILQLKKTLKEIGVGEIVTISGRDFAMNNNGQWQLTAKCLQAMLGGLGDISNTAEDVFVNAYRNGLTDRSIVPTVIKNSSGFLAKISDNDSVILSNLKADNFRQLVLGILGMHNFNLKTSIPRNLFFTTFFPMFFPAAVESKIFVAFPPEKLEQTLGKIISNNNLRQFRITESIKQKHISSYFNSDDGDIISGEDRIIIESSDKENFLSSPEMQSKEITKKTIQAIKLRQYDFILVNYPNADTLAHSGNLSVTADAVLAVDQSIAEIYREIISVDGTLIVVSDHGNAEQMINSADNFDRENFHSLNPVPFILARSDLKDKKANHGYSNNILSEMIAPKFGLADVAPTILNLLGIEKPIEMTGKNILSDII